MYVNLWVFVPLWWFVCGWLSSILMWMNNRYERHSYLNAPSPKQIFIGFLCSFGGILLLMFIIVFHTIDMLQHKQIRNWWNRPLWTVEREQ